MYVSIHVTGVAAVHGPANGMGGEVVLRESSQFGSGGTAYLAFEDDVAVRNFAAELMTLSQVRFPALYLAIREQVIPLEPAEDPVDEGVNG
jgi:hypothetical protein